MSCAVATRMQDIDLAHEPPAEDLSQPADDLTAAPDLTVARDLSGIDLGALPQSWGSPSTAPTDLTLAWGGNYATNYRVTLAANDPTAMIYYTTDGTAPSLSSPNGAMPVIDIALTTRLRWFAANAAGMEAPHDDSYGVDAANQSKAGFVVYDVDLDGQGPVATANGTINGQATFRFWYQSGGCSGGMFPCAAQLVYGVDKVDQGCLFDGGANAFANSATQTKSFTVTVPAAPGVHDVQVAQIEDLSCAMAMTAMTLKNRPNLVRIGVLIVK
jgi:Chitobiase/beta-hexosaminidase C-terminal domain